MSWFGGKSSSNDSLAPGAIGASEGERKMANIGKSISIVGDLTGNEDIAIEGNVEGKVNLPDGQLTIGASGTVQGEVRAKSVVVIGRVVGNVSGSERVEVQGSGRVEGDVSAPRLVVAEGGVLNGSIHMGADAAQETPAPPSRAVGQQL